MSAAIGGILPDPANMAGLENDAQQPAPSKPADGKPAEKTISCVSCRKRKLKCDRTKPKCSTCLRLRHECEYPERRRNLGSKRRNMKELEARLAQVETKLGGDKAAEKLQPSVVDVEMEQDWDAFGIDIPLDLSGDQPDIAGVSFEMPSFGMGMEPPVFQPEDYLNHELLALGLQEPLPPQDMMDELFRIYFERFHETMPMMHKARFYASLDRAPNMRPPVSLRYAMWTMGASIEEAYSSVEDLLYERARKYIQAEEMKGHGEAFVSIYHAHTWAIIAQYEAKKTYFSRSWMSAGRTIRLVQMLGLDRVDHDTPGIKTILPPPKDAIEREERRRTFWAAYYADRWASSGTGWPMVVVENEIKTNLPISDYAFEHGLDEATIPLSEALTPEGASKISPFAGVIISATLFGHNFQHLHRDGPDELPDDLQNGEFWKRHRRMDNVLSNTFMFLPDRLRIPSGISDMNVIFLNLNIHCSTICLHQAGVAVAKKHKLDVNFIRQCQTRCIMAADEITNIMRLCCHIEPAKMHSWLGFCLFVASGVYVKDQVSDQPCAQSLPNLQFLLAAMRAISRKHLITQHFVAQLELDIEAAGIFKKNPNGERVVGGLPRTPLAGILPDRKGAPMTYEEMQSYLTNRLTSDIDPGSSRISTLTPESRHSSASESPVPTTASISEFSNPIMIPDKFFQTNQNFSEWGGEPGVYEVQELPQGDLSVGSFVTGLSAIMEEVDGTFYNSSGRSQAVERQNLNPVGVDIIANNPMFNKTSNWSIPLRQTTQTPPASSGSAYPYMYISNAPTSIVTEKQSQPGFVSEGEHEGGEPGGNAMVERLLWLRGDK